MEFAFKFLVLIAQLMAVFTVAAAIADHIVAPVLRAREKRKSVNG